MGKTGWFKLLLHDIEPTERQVSIMTKELAVLQETMPIIMYLAAIIRVEREINAGSNKSDKAR